ncbi:MAG: Crp/Fnr family transcriptional regulator [Erysipelothrix sp.]|nr:Crp/Fnr family transcriptional regulator [Erysipelothrix sp.]
MLSINHLFNEFFYGVTEIDESSFTPFNIGRNDNLLIDEGFVYFLLEGTIAEYRHAHHQHQVINVYRMHHFDQIGVYELFYPSQNKISYKAITECLVYALAKDLFMELMQKNHEFHQRVLINLINRQSFIAQHYIDLISLSVKERVKHFISFTIDSRYLEQHEQFVVADSHQVMADTLGCNIRSVHRALKSLAKENTIDIVNGKVTISKIQHQKCAVAL